MHSPLLIIVAEFASSINSAAMPVSEAGPRFGPLPQCSVDGAYLGTRAPDGSTHWEYLGHFQSLARAEQPIAQLLSKRANGANCGGALINVDDRANAISGFENMCSQGLTYTDSAITYQSGSVIAYGCNYGSSQTCTSSQVSGDFNLLGKECGTNHAAFFSDEDNNNSYGYTPAGSGYC